MVGKVGNGWAPRVEGRELRSSGYYLQSTATERALPSSSPRDAAGDSALWEDVLLKNLQPEAFLWSSREDLIMTTSCVVLCGLTRPQADQMDLLRKAVGNASGSHSRKTVTAGDLVEALAVWAPQP